eukprot:TRINITY_DN7611_c1_g1_i1.p1 TRINITY_DN7611_c1_g1~~TRINITY_DN7611_c1_g1_i1.p1  ORF type:complete len:967 (-),score=367.32 TRINITY_DN7611_c1_g1_i1:9-2909(-)
MQKKAEGSSPTSPNIVGREADAKAKRGMKYETLRNWPDSNAEGFPLASFTDILITLLQIQKFLLESVGSLEIDSERRIECLEKIRDMTQITVALEQFLKKMRSRFSAHSNINVRDNWTRLQDSFYPLKDSLVMFIKETKDRLVGNNQKSGSSMDGIVALCRNISSNIRTSTFAAEALDNAMMGSSNNNNNVISSPSLRVDVSKFAPSSPKGRKKTFETPPLPNASAIRAPSPPKSDRKAQTGSIKSKRSDEDLDLNGKKAELSPSIKARAVPFQVEKGEKGEKSSGKSLEKSTSSTSMKKMFYNSLLRKKTPKSSASIEWDELQSQLSSDIGIIFELAEGPESKRQWREHKDSVKSTLQSMKKCAESLQLAREQERVEFCVVKFLKEFAGVFDDSERISESDARTRKMHKVVIEDNLWWFDRLKEYKQVEFSLKEREDQVRKREEQSLYREQKLENEILAFAKIAEENSSPVTSPKGKLTSGESVSSFSSFSNSSSELDQKFLIQVGLPLHGVIKTVPVNANETAEELLTRLVSKYYLRYAPQSDARDFLLKVPGQELFIDNATPFFQVEYVKEHRSSKNPFHKIELLLVEKDNKLMRGTYDLVRKAEEKADNMESRAVLGDTYRGTPEQLMKVYRAEVSTVLRELAQDYGINYNDIQTLLDDPKVDEENQGKELKSLLNENIEMSDGEFSSNLLDLLNRINSSIEQLFDEYEGIRQIKDLRGLPEIGDRIIVDGTQTNNLIRRVMYIISILVIENNLKIKNNFDFGMYSPFLSNPCSSNKNASSLQPFTNRSDEIMKHFMSLKMAILRDMRQVSSLMERKEGIVFNCVYARYLTSQYLEIMEEFLVNMKKEFDTRLARIKNLSPELQTKIYAGFHGPIQVEFQVVKQFSEIRSWVNNLIEIQVVSTIQREIFASNVTVLEDNLRQNTSRMINGFKGMLEGAVPLAVIRLQDLMQYIDGYIRQDSK